MKKHALLLVFAVVFCLGLCGCLEQPTSEPAVDETGHSEPIPDMAVVSDGSLSAVVVGKAADGITLEITNSGNDNTISATFTSAKLGGREYDIKPAGYADSPLSIVRDGETEKTMNLSLPANDFVRLKVSSTDLTSEDDYDNVDLVYSETYMGDDGPVTKTGRTISIKNA